jgi:hypothetical protein
MRWAWHVVSMGEMRSGYKIFIRVHLEEEGIDGG